MKRQDRRQLPPAHECRLLDLLVSLITPLLRLCVASVAALMRPRKRDVKEKTPRSKGEAAKRYNVIMGLF